MPLLCSRAVVSQGWDPGQGSPAAVPAAGVCARHEQNSSSPSFHVGADFAVLTQLITVCGLSKMKIVLFGIFPGLLQQSLGSCLWKIRICVILFEHHICINTYIYKFCGVCLFVCCFLKSIKAVLGFLDVLSS